MKRIGIMTGGGDCPGLNAAIRAVVRVGTNHFGYEIVGIRDGFEGLIDNRSTPLAARDTRGILRIGGTILGSSNRANPFRYSGPNGDQPETDASEEAYRNARNLGVDALVVVGGDGTLLLAGQFANRYDIPTVGIPKTIDNDVRGSDYAIGFDTAVATVTDAVDKLHTTAESHHRVLLVETMGRTAGWIALYAGVAGGADVVLIPERSYNLQDIKLAIDERARNGHRFTIAVVAEGVAAPDGHAVYRSTTGAEHNWKLGGVCQTLAEILDNEVEQDVRSLVLGHLQRGGSPTAFDRTLATQLGASAVQTVAAGDHNVIVGMLGLEVTSTPLSEVAIGPRLVSDNHPMVTAASQMGMYIG